MTVEPQKRNRNVSFLSHPSFLVVIPTCHVWTRMIKRLPTPPGRQWLLLGEGCLKPRPSVVPLFHRRSFALSHCPSAAFLPSDRTRLAQVADWAIAAILQMYLDVCVPGFYTMEIFSSDPKTLPLFISFPAICAACRTVSPMRKVIWMKIPQKHFFSQTRFPNQFAPRTQKLLSHQRCGAGALGYRSRTGAPDWPLTLTVLPRVQHKPQHVFNPRNRVHVFPRYVIQYN